MEREVVVVGAGPAGSTTAMALAQQGRDVLLVDRQDFPRDKVCGDAIPGSALSVLYDLGMEQRIKDSNFYAAHSLLLCSPSEYVIEAELNAGPRGEDSCVVPRYVFDHTLQQHALDSGVDFLRAQVKEPLIEDGRVTGVRIRQGGKNEEIRAKVVVGADGVTSVIARALRPEKHEDKHRAVALRAYIENLDLLPRQVEFYLFKSILPGYAWIFPMGENRANIGLGMRLDMFRKNDKDLEQLLEVFMDMPVIKKRLHPDTKLENVASWQLNFGSQKKIRRSYDGALLVGDSAGMINPLTGGGISNAVHAGSMAASTIHRALGNSDRDRPDAEVLSQYDRLCHEAFWPSMKRSFWIQRSLNTWPMWVDVLVRWGSSNSSLAQTFVSKL